MTLNVGPISAQGNSPVKFTKLFQGSFARRADFAQSSLPASSAVLLGDEPDLTVDFRFRAPLIGLAGLPLPRSVAILTPPAGRFAPDADLAEIFDAAGRGEFPFAQVQPIAGRFEVSTPVLREGDYECWVLVVDN